MVVEQIRAGDQRGELALYASLAGGARFFLRRHTGTDDVDDLVHDVFLTVIDAIRTERLREPDRLMGFVRTILFRQAASVRRERAMPGASLDSAPVQAVPDAGLDSVKILIEEQHRRLMHELIQELRPRDYEILRRFYFAGETEAQIRAAMNLTATQFRLLKSRAKERFKELVRERLQQPGTTPQ